MARLLIAVLLVTTSLPVMALTIAQQGEPVVVIALPDKPGGPEAEAASELTAYLGKLTGGVFEQVAEGNLAGRRAMLLGATAAAASAGISAEQLDRDGFIIKVAQGNLYIVGHDATATR